MCTMLTIYSRHYNQTNDRWESISSHIFTKSKQPSSDFKSGLNLIRDELQKRNIPCRPMVKFTDNCCSEFKSRYVFGGLKNDDAFVGVYKTPGKYLMVFIKFSRDRYCST